MGWIGADAGEAQEREQSLQALRELLIYFCKNSRGMDQDFTSVMTGGHNVTAAALAARVGA